MRITLLIVSLLLVSALLLPRAARAEGIEQMTYDGLMDFVIENQGKVVLVNFWATWCGPCLKEMPGLVQMRNEVSPERLAMANVSLDYDPKAVAAFVEKKKLNYPNYIASPDLMELLEIRAIPMMLLYDTDGMEVVSHEGYIPLDELRPKILELLPAE